MCDWLVLQSPNEVSKITIIGVGCAYQDRRPQQLLLSRVFPLLVKALITGVVITDLTGGFVWKSVAMYPVLVCHREPPCVGYVRRLSPAAVLLEPHPLWLTSKTTLAAAAAANTGCCTIIIQHTIGKSLLWSLDQNTWLPVRNSVWYENHRTILQCWRQKRRRLKGNAGFLLVAAESMAP